MRWSVKKRPKTPLIPGRDRPAKAQGSPLYSYYGQRRPVAATERGRDSREPQTATSAPQSCMYTLMLFVCVLVGVVCAVKILALSGDSKIIVTENQQSLELPTVTYAGVVNESLKSSLLNSNKITLNTKGVARDLQREFPELSSVVVTVPLVGNRPVVYVKPLRASFVIESPNGLYTMADTGYILARLSAPQDGLTTLSELGRRQPAIGKQFLPASTVSFAKTVSYQLSQAGMAVAKVELPSDAPYELRIRLVAKPYYLRFNLQADALQQSGGAVAALRKVTASQLPREYVDMRVLGRVYYR